MYESCQSRDFDFIVLEIPPYHGGIPLAPRTAVDLCLSFFTGAMNALRATQQIAL